MRQIVIQSDWDDVSTHDVMHWIEFLAPGKFELLRLNDATQIQSLSCRINDQCSTTLKVKQGTVASNTLQSFWYRRGGFTFPPARVRPVASEQGLDLINGIQGNIAREQKYISDCLYGSLRANGHINTFRDNHTNKMDNLAKAVKAGLNVPDTLVTNDMRELLAFAQTHAAIISKDISFQPVDFLFNERYRVRIGPRVRVLSQQDIMRLMEKYEDNPIAGYALYQQYVDKQYELRIFYLKGKCYSMAIFSQANEKTKTDFRNYDETRPNRCVPFNLPRLMTQKIKRFMQAIDMNCGSLDVIVTPENNFVFLEVNPVGQFQWLSEICNYGIEQHLAYALIKGKYGRAKSN